MAAVTHATGRETLVPENVFIYSRTDAKGRITEANEAFAELSGYAAEELIGKPHNIVRHPDMPKEAFADMWKSLKAGRPWQGVVKNLRKDGGFYWVLATVSPLRAQGGQIIGFQSLRRRPSRDLVESASRAYGHICRGDRSLRIEEGRVLRNPSSLVRWTSRPDLRFALGAILGLGASLAGMGLQFFGASNPVSRIACTVAFALGCMGSLLVLLSTLPNLLQDMDEIDTYLDQLLASGDFTTPFNSNQRGRSARIARKLGLLSGWLQSTIQCIQDAVVPVEAGTKQIGLAIRAIDKAAADQSMSTASVAAATAELELTIREVAQHLESTQAAVQETGRRAADGANVSQRATERIQELAVVVKSASTQVEALEASSSEVGAIATVIREIADQTNLLALNASIEAARAGEAGRGFAVVANEVRSLADRTTKATGKINSLIEAIKGDSDRATAGIRAGAEQVTSGVGFVHDAQVALSDINELMAEAVRRVTEITTSSSQQTEAMGEISTNIARVSAMTEQNVSVVRKTTSLIGDLAPMVDRVKQAVEQYRV